MLTAFKSVPLSILHKVLVGLELNASRHFNPHPTTQPDAGAPTYVLMVRLPVNCQTTRLTILQEH